MATAQTTKPETAKPETAPVTAETTTTTVTKKVARVEETKPYRYHPLVPGARHFANPTGDGMEELSAGATVNLTKRQALAFADRFIPVDPNNSFTPGVRVASPTKPLPNSDEPQDQSAKTPDPRIPPGTGANVPTGSRATE